AWTLFGVALAPGRFWLDLGGALLLGLVLYAIARRFSLFALLLGILLALFYLGNAAKIAFLGAPTLPDDAYALPALIEILQPAARALVVLPPLLILGLLIVNFRASRSAAIAGALVAAMAGVILFAPQRVTAMLDPLTGYVEWDQAQTYRLRGPIVHVLQETARFVADRPVAPDAATVATAYANRLAVVEPAT